MNRTEQLRQREVMRRRIRVVIAQRRLAQEPTPPVEPVAAEGRD